MAVIPLEGPSLKLGNTQEEPVTCKVHGPWRYGLQGYLGHITHVQVHSGDLSFQGPDAMTVLIGDVGEWPPLRSQVSSQMSASSP